MVVHFSFCKLWTSTAVALVATGITLSQHNPIKKAGVTSRLRTERRYEIVTSNTRIRRSSRASHNTGRTAGPEQVGCWVQNHFAELAWSAGI